MMRLTNSKPSKEDVQRFVNENFSQEDELVQIPLPDWTEEPELARRVKDPYFRKWVKDLNEIWKNLARRMTPQVRDYPDRHSLIYVNKTFIIPGGRFKGLFFFFNFILNLYILKTNSQLNSLLPSSHLVFASGNCLFFISHQTR